MGLLDDAVQVFEVARQGSQGQPKELDCLTMIGLLQGMRGDAAQAVGAFRDALASPHAGPREVSLRYELGVAHEAAGARGRRSGSTWRCRRPSRHTATSRTVCAGCRPRCDPRKTDRRAPRSRSAGIHTAVPTRACADSKTRKVGYL